MSEQVVTHELFEYNEKEPFHIFNITGNADVGDRLKNHWHEELEILYCFRGHCRHYINGVCIVDQPGRLITTNSGFIHNIIPDQELLHSDVLVGCVIIIHPRLIESVFPDYRDIYFTNSRQTACRQIQSIAVKLSEYAKAGEHGEYDYLYAKSLITALLYYMCQEGTVRREQVDHVNTLKNIERMKGVLQFIETHYMERISQSMVAEKFYFSPVYFSRIFKKYTGITFTEYLTERRLEKARMDLLYSQKSVLGIAMEHGFSDDRRLILAFKKKYGTTPLQYRKSKL